MESYNCCDPHPFINLFLGVISWKSDISSDEDLSGVIPMETGTAASDWTKEPEETGEGADQSPGWADFSKFSDSVGANVIRSTQR